MDPKSARKLVDDLCQELDLAAQRRKPRGGGLAAFGLAVGLATTGGAGVALSGCGDDDGGPVDSIPFAGDAYGIMQPDASVDAIPFPGDAYGIPRPDAAVDAITGVGDAYGIPQPDGN